jgi:hypothetical protein
MGMQDAGEGTRYNTRYKTITIHSWHGYGWPPKASSPDGICESNIARDR